MADYAPPHPHNAVFSWQDGEYIIPSAYNVVFHFNSDVYRPPHPHNLVFNFDSEIYAPPHPHNIVFGFGKKEGATTQYVATLGLVETVVGRLSVFGEAETVATKGIYVGAHGAVSINNKNTPVTAIGFNSSDFSRLALVKNFNKEIKPLGIDSLSFGTTYNYNLKQFVLLQGYSASKYGISFVQGGIKTIPTQGYITTLFGSTKAINTTGDQSVTPLSIDKSAVANPSVSPRIIYPLGFLAGGFGQPVARPNPSPKGFIASLYGTSWVSRNPRGLAASIGETFDAGYPKVFDPTQYFSPSPTLRSSVFGDVRIRNNNSYLRAPSIDSQAISEWATVEARDKTLYAKSFVAQAFGSQSIKNKSPSIFFNGLPAPIFYNQAIGYRIRAVAPTGFDRLELGKPTVIKTPELFPRSYVATQFGTQWVSNYTRYIENNSKDHSSVGKPTAWFRYRYSNPDSWQSSKFDNKTTLTHGVREVIGRGFIQQAYGNAWLSRGVRLLEPLSIVKNQQASNHFVGRHQEIKPVGYIATLFGTRIIPEIQSVYPLGFAGVFGLALADLAVRYLKPKGYLSAGEQPAFRWGRQIVYNNTQYIIQNFSGDNGLVPPKWSDWTSIENRNKTIGAIGTLSQRFGYAQIENNARLLEPQGLIATIIGDGMIAYRIRYLPLQGIEAPYMSDWIVIHNAARIIKPAGEVQSLFGNAELVKTRRYLDRIGRIESQEFGLGMIAYRIRTLDIEKRYSIAPPIIRPPTIDLYTRYIEFNGYETAKYGSPSLSIHFRIITPRWTHSEKSGSPALHNVTPELLTRGHDSQDYGNAKIRTQWRNIYAVGSNASLIGLLKVSDTKRHLSVPGFIDSLASQKHTVIKTASAPYSKQYIFLNDENGDSGGEGFGIEPFNMPSPLLNQNVLYQKGQLSSKFGMQFVWSNNLIIKSGIAIEGVSSELAVINKNRYIRLDGIENIIVLGKPSLSPHTIWAVKEAPQQAIDNHTAIADLHYVGETKVRAPGESFGKANLQSTIRSIKPSFFTSLNIKGFGSPSLSLSLTIVRPTSLGRLSRFGIPKIPFTRQDIAIREGIKGVSFGASLAKLAPYLGPRFIEPKPLSSLSVGQHYSDNFIRNIYAKSIDSLLMGKSLSGDRPFMWQGLRIGEHVPLTIGGNNMSLLGAAVIGLRVRELSPQGFNDFASGYDLTNFNERMLVVNSDKKLPVVKILIPISITPANNYGTTDIKPGQHFIRPDGNSNQFRKGGYHA